MELIHFAVHFWNVLVVYGEFASVHEIQRHCNYDVKDMVFALTRLGQLLDISHRRCASGGSAHGAENRACINAVLITSRT